MTLTFLLRRPALLAAVLISSLPAGAMADPYELPIAGSGPVNVQTTSAATVSSQQLARQVGYARFTAADWHPGEIRHLVLIQFKDGATVAQREEATARFIHLAQDSRRPDGKAVIASIETGLQASGEGQAHGFQQAFLLTFRSEGDRNYFVGRPVVTDPAFLDPAHEAFKEFLTPLVEKILVFDYPVAFSTAPEKIAQKPAKRRK